MIEQVVEFMRFLKYASKKEQAKHSISNIVIFCRSVNPLADEFIAIADDFDETPECFKEAINSPNNMLENTVESSMIGMRADKKYDIL